MKQRLAGGSRGCSGDCVALGDWDSICGPQHKGPECQAKELKPLPAGAEEPGVVLEQGWEGQSPRASGRRAWREVGTWQSPGADMPSPSPRQLPTSLAGSWGCKTKGLPSALRRRRQSRRGTRADVRRSLGGHPDRCRAPSGPPAERETSQDARPGVKGLSPGGEATGLGPTMSPCMGWRWAFPHQHSCSRFPRGT